MIEEACAVVNPGICALSDTTPGVSPPRSYRPLPSVTTRPTSRPLWSTTVTVTPGSAARLSSRTVPAIRASPPTSAAACVCGARPAPAASGTMGRDAKSGADSGCRNACGSPATSDSSTLFQSAALMLSTTAQPCSVGWRSAAVGKMRRYVVFHTAASPT